MNIVIAGAGDVGVYVASMLSSERHNVILIDGNSKRLEQASWQLDIATRVGSATDWELLDELAELGPDLFIALTDSDETNLVAASLAKNLGYLHTAVRLRGTNYFHQTRLDFAQLFSVDKIIAPELLVAQDILKYILEPGFLAVDYFAQGAVQLRTLAIPANWSYEKIPLCKLALPAGVMVGLIRRKDPFSQIIFPHGDDTILPGDEVTFLGKVEAITKIATLFKLTIPTPKAIVIMGGSLTAVNLARIVRKRKIHVRIIEPCYERCLELAKQLPECTIINQDGTDMEFLRGEHINFDCLIAASQSDELNILTALSSQKIGCSNPIVLLSSRSHREIVESLGISCVVSPRVSAANAILSFIATGKISSMVSLHDNRAEIVEIKVSMRSKITGIPLAELAPLFPKNFLIAMIQNRGRTMIANGNCIISPGDSIIVITHPQHLSQLEKLF